MIYLILVAIMLLGNAFFTIKMLHEKEKQIKELTDEMHLLEDKKKYLEKALAKLEDELVAIRTIS